MSGTWVVVDATGLITVTECCATLTAISLSGLLCTATWYLCDMMVLVHSSSVHDKSVQALSVTHSFVIHYVVQIKCAGCHALLVRL